MRFKVTLRRENYLFGLKWLLWWILKACFCKLISHTKYFLNRKMEHGLLIIKAANYMHWTFECHTHTDLLLCAPALPFSPGQWCLTLPPLPQQPEPHKTRPHQHREPKWLREICQLKRLYTFKFKKCMTIYTLY